MDSIIRTIVENHRTGLQLMTLPTGMGKTYAMKEFIRLWLPEHLSDEEPRNIVLVTSLKKNLIHEDLREVFVEAGHPELYDDYCLFLDSVSESVLDGWDDSLGMKIEKTFPNNETARDFVNTIRLIRSLNGAKDVLSRDKKIIRDRFARDTEPAFRRMLRTTVREKCGRTVEDRYRTVTENSNWNWVSQIYPAVHVTKRRIFSMSADKFVSTCDTIIGKSATIYDSDITKDAIVFIDEFDSTKSRIQNAIIRKNLRRNIDLLDMFNRIRRGLDDVENHPNRLYRPAPGMNATEESLREHETNVRRRFNKIAEKYRLGYNKKVIFSDVRAGNRFIFHGDSILSVSSNNDLVSMHFDEKENMDFIDLTGTQDGWESVKSMFREIRGAIRKFSRFVSKLSVNYSKDRSDPSMSFEDCIESVLGQFGLSNDQKLYMIDEVLMSSDRQKSSRVDDSFYEQGFRYYTFRDDRNENLRSIIDMVSMDSTPEKVLLRVCRRALVFGLSATAELDTVIGNYDLEYMSSELGTDFLPRISDNPRLLSLMDRAWSNYDCVKIEVDTCTAKSNGEYDKELWNKVFEDSVDSEIAIGSMSLLEEYEAERYLRAAFSFKSFLINDTKAGLCFFNRMPKDEDPIFDRAALSGIFDMILKEHPEVSLASIAFISSEGFEETKKDIQNRLSEGERILAVTTYGTLGAGQNIQYPLKDGGCVNISGRPDDNEVDFDFIYLDNPTNVVSNPEKKNDEKWMGLVYEILYLLEKGEIDRKTANSFVAKTLLLSDIKHVRGTLLATRSARLAAAGKIIQAVGRICRTNMKRPTIRILADEDLSKVFMDPEGTYGLTNRETEALIRHVHGPETRIDDSVTVTAALRSRRAATIIDRMRGNWNPSTISDWKGLREYVLKSPTTDKPSDYTFNMYIKMPDRGSTYWYRTKNDFEDVEVMFDRPVGACEEVSEQTARLDELMSVPSLRGMFDERGYATGFNSARYVLSPPLFKNIYKGAIGEVVGDHIMRLYGFEPEPVPDEHFEMFDAVLSEGIYIDYKHWSSSDFTDEDEQTAKIFGKLSTVEGRAAVVANVLRREDDNSVSRTYVKGGMTILTIPWLFGIENGRIMPNQDAVLAIRRLM